MISYLGSLVQFSPATGRAGRCRQISLCVDSTTVFRPHWACPAHGCLCFPRLHCSGSWLLYMERALCCVWFQFSGTPQKCVFGCACVLCLPRPERLRQPGAWAPSPQMRRAFSLRGPSVRHRPGAAACVCSQELASSRDPLGGGGCQPFRISVSH